MTYDPYRFEHYRFPRQQPLDLLQREWREDPIIGMRYALRWAVIFWLIVAVATSAIVAYAGPAEKQCMTEALNARQIALWARDLQPEAGVHYLLDRLAVEHLELGLSPEDVAAQHDLIRRLYRTRVTPDGAFDSVYHECTRVSLRGAG